MEKFLIATATFASMAMAAPAYAADLPVKAPPPPPAPVYTWTGWYVGGNVGYSWGRANTDLRGNGEFTSTNSSNPPGPTLVTPFAFADSNTAHPNGVIGGGQIGYNYQFSPNGALGFEAIGLNYKFDWGKGKAPVVARY